MKFSIATLLTLVAIASAYSIQEHNELIRRQGTVGVSASEAAMTDAQGNVIAFDATKVYKDSTAKGL